MKAKVIKTGEIVDVYHEPQYGQITDIYKESVLVNGRMWTEDELDFCVKANAPEKIYLQENTTTDCYGEFWPEWFEARLKDTDVEYTRTDAFIEKAENYLRNKCQRFILTEKDITGFINYIKGE